MKKNKQKLKLQFYKIGNKTDRLINYILNQLKDIMI